MPINQNQALFSLLGTTFGGDGRVNFGLPDLRGRAPIHVGSGHTLGERGGEQAHTLSIAELPTHTHGAFGTSNSTDPNGTNIPTANLLASGPSEIYAGAASWAPWAQPRCPRSADRRPTSTCSRFSH